jgi:hypothetical protein
MEVKRFSRENEDAVMCRASDFLRGIVGIRDYTPGALPPAKTRKLIRHGARSQNGHGPGLDAPTNPVIANLSREHRIIRQMAADAARYWGRGQQSDSRGEA